MEKMLWREGLLIVWICICAMIDYRQRRLPNSLTLGAAAVAIFYMLIHGRSVLGASPLSALAAGISVVFLLAPCLWLEWLGAGDIKLMSAIGFIGGPEVLAITFVFSSILTMPAALWINRDRARHRQPGLAKSRGVPQGVFIALGLLLAMLGRNGLGGA